MAAAEADNLFCPRVPGELWEVKVTICGTRSELCVAGVEPVSLHINEAARLMSSSQASTPAGLV